MELQASSVTNFFILYHVNETRTSLNFYRIILNLAVTGREERRPLATGETF